MLRAATRTASTTKPLSGGNHHAERCPEIAARRPTVATIQPQRAEEHDAFEFALAETAGGRSAWPLKVADGKFSADVFKTK
ncbi:hypothetical protein [Burkholderia ubonensis]|uniref:hypothetical protein n=1 Tax=Burkholderia ubonensis TaxID=101571 RepID=UPI000AA16C3A|nr:hypothetical protein [Burkholderia ubonensis]